MSRKSLIYTRDIRTWTEDPVHLEYYLLNDALLDGCAECYGVEVRAHCRAGTQYAGVHGVTTVGSRILELLDTLAREQIMPAQLYEAVRAWS